MKLIEKSARLETNFLILVFLSTIVVTTGLASVLVGKKKAKRAMATYTVIWVLTLFLLVTIIYVRDNK